jgi:hypothetical protein
MVELWTRNREAEDDDESNLEDISRYEIQGVQLTLLGVADIESLLLQV